MTRHDVNSYGNMAAVTSEIHGRRLINTGNSVNCSVKIEFIDIFRLLVLDKLLKMFKSLNANNIVFRRWEYGSPLSHQTRELNHQRHSIATQMRIDMTQLRHR